MFNFFCKVRKGGCDRHSRGLGFGGGGLLYKLGEVWFISGRLGGCREL